MASGTWRGTEYGAKFAAHRFVQRAVAQMAELYGMDPYYVERRRGDLYTDVVLVCEGVGDGARALWMNVLIQGFAGFVVQCDGREREELLREGGEQLLAFAEEIVVEEEAGRERLYGAEGPPGGERAEEYDRRTLPGLVEEALRP